MKVMWALLTITVVCKSRRGAQTIVKYTHVCPNRDPDGTDTPEIM